MRILVIGSGAREHALLVALAADPAVTELHAAPGNPGMVQAQCHELTVTDPAAVTA
ncbi:phosphoribosylamine--glycine ligase N-terminal domain-containing protein, partial [Dietzia maris]